MAAQLELIPSYVLHTLKYRETSLLVDVFTADRGYIRLVAKGALRNKSPMRGLLQAFVPIAVSWYGRGPLYSLRTVESRTELFHFTDSYLLCALYLNELLLRLLHYEDSYPSLFVHYEASLRALANRECCETALRIFEKNLLNELGYGIDLTQDCEEQPIMAEYDYIYEPGTGFYRSLSLAKNTVCGKSILAFAQNDLRSKEALRDAKKIMRFSLAPYLGDKPLKTRELFMTGI